ncbi:MOSC domain-containing protein [Chloroflexota bacterium]
MVARLVAVCRSDEKGTSKKMVDKAVVKEAYGLVDDAHADSSTHRQVSLLAIESIKKMGEMGLDIQPGDFAENLTTEGIELTLLPIGTWLAVGDDVLLEVSQIGKKCHTGCAIFRQVGKCIMPQEGVFAKVIQGGQVKEGDGLRVLLAKGRK